MRIDKRQTPAARQKHSLLKKRQKGNLTIWTLLHAGSMREGCEFEKTRPESERHRVEKKKKKWTS